MEYMYLTSSDAHGFLPICNCHIAWHYSFMSRRLTKRGSSHKRAFDCIVARIFLTLVPSVYLQTSVAFRLHFFLNGLNNRAWKISGRESTAFIIGGHPEKNLLRWTCIAGHVQLLQLLDKRNDVVARLHASSSSFLIGRLWWLSGWFAVLKEWWWTSNRRKEIK